MVSPQAQSRPVSQPLAERVASMDESSSLVIGWLERAGDFVPPVGLVPRPPPFAHSPKAVSQWHSDCLRDALQIP